MPQNFGSELVACKLSCGMTLPEIFPSTKFIFLTAKRRRATIYKRSRIHQWFDNCGLDDPTDRQELQYDGLRETTEIVHRLVRTEAAVLNGDSKNIVIGGLSQGCAAGLISTLSFVERDNGPIRKKMDGAKVDDLRTVGGFFGMSGWLPFAQDILSAAVPSSPEGYEAENDLGIFFERDCDKNEADDKNVELDQSHFARQYRAISFIRDLVDLDSLHMELPLSGQKGAQEDADKQPLLQSVPCFIGHGSADPKVPIKLGIQMRDVLTSLGMNVMWKQYDEFGHWYKVPEELDDIVQFLKTEVGLVGV